MDRVAADGVGLRAPTCRTLFFCAVAAQRDVSQLHASL